jgi:phospholipid/cholesterol/gamma-HCH transport system ATP-binding protein
MGKSGSGKSVMIKCLIGLEIPDSGSIKVMGEIGINRSTLDELRTEIGFLFREARCMIPLRKSRISFTTPH